MNFLLAGYFGFNNAGDELILSSMIENLRSRFPCPEISVLSNTPELARSRYSIRAYNRWNLRDIYHSIKQCSIIIFSGGLYQDTTGSMSLYYYLGLILTAKILKKKIYLCAVDFNPLKHRINYFILRVILNLADKITVRTRVSHELLEKTAGFKHMDIVEITADTVFTGKNTNCADKTVPGKYIVGLILRARKDSCAGIDSTVFSGIVDNVNLLVHPDKCELLFIPFQPAVDAGFCESISGRIPGSRVVYWENPDELSGAIAQVNFLISERLHGLILGMLYNKPLLAVSTDTKLKGFFDELGGIVIPELVNLSDHVIEYLRKQQDYKINQSKISGLKQRSDRNYKIITEEFV